MMEGYMSGSELRQYLHISTRKMKYLMDNDYIPHINTGQATYKYLIPIDEVEKFKFNMENNPNFLSELNGLFSCKQRYEKHEHNEYTNNECKNFQIWLKKEWSDIPDALPCKMAAKLIGANPQRVNKLVKDKTLYGVVVGTTQLCVKDEFIEYTTSYKMVNTFISDVYQCLIKKWESSIS